MVAKQRNAKQSNFIVNAGWVYGQLYSWCRAAKLPLVPSRVTSDYSFTGLRRMDSLWLVVPMTGFKSTRVNLTRSKIQSLNHSATPPSPEEEGGGEQEDDGQTT